MLLFTSISIKQWELKAAVTQSLHRNEQVAAEGSHGEAKRLQFLVQAMAWIHGG